MHYGFIRFKILQSNNLQRIYGVLYLYTELLALMGFNYIKKSHDLIFAYVYAYQPNFENSTLILKLILRVFHQSLFYRICFQIIKNTYIKILFTNYFSFVNMLGRKTSFVSPRPRVQERRIFTQHVKRESLLVHD